ncbi:MAG: hypothetical protein RID42_17975 [Alphaproteobacteria bacterium]
MLQIELSEGNDVENFGSCSSKPWAGDDLCAFISSSHLMSTLSAAWKRCRQISKAIYTAIEAVDRTVNSFARKVIRALIDPVLFFGSLFFVLLSMTTFVDPSQIEQNSRPEGTTLANLSISVVLMLLAYLALGVSLFREKRHIFRVCWAAFFVLFLHPVFFSFVFRERGCLPGFSSVEDNILAVYAIWTGSGPDIQDVEGPCRAILVSGSLSGYVGLAILFAIFISLFERYRTRTRPPGDGVS